MDLTWSTLWKAIHHLAHLSCQVTAKATVLFATTASFGMLVMSMQNLGLIGMMTVEWPLALDGIFSICKFLLLDIDSYGFSCIAGRTSRMMISGCDGHRFEFWCEHVGAIQPYPYLFLMLHKSRTSWCDLRALFWDTPWWYHNTLIGRPRKRPLLRWTLEMSIFGLEHRSVRTHPLSPERIDLPGGCGLARHLLGSVQTLSTEVSLEWIKSR